MPRARASQPTAPPPAPSPLAGSSSPNTDEWGIDLRWVDAHESEQTVARETVETLRAAIGRPPSDLELTAPLVLRPGASLTGLPGVDGPLDVVCEDGSARRLSGTVPLDFPLGYHRVRTAGSTERMLIVSPGRCWLPEGWRAWGWTVQLYAARSESSWGFGDLGDLRSIRDWAKESGAGFLLVNPLHAVSPTFPQEPSPYLPASRRFRNPLYLRVEGVPGADLVDLAILRTEGRGLSAAPLIDRDAVWRVKRDALQRIFDANADAGHLDGGDFARWRAELGAPLEEFAIWCALADEHGLDFHDWPEELHRPDSAAVTDFRAKRGAEITFHAWLQWTLEEQVRAATEGMTVLQDLPIGVDGGGADAWAWQDQLADGVRIGAPPDLFNTQGQNWGSPPLIPWRLRAADYTAFVEAIRATMAATGGLRIDHVMGLFRLWWLPADGSAADGAYVRYPSADLLNIVALESHRAKAIVVGEDLGTVEPGVREAMAEHAILSYRLLWFEEAEPEQWPTQSMAAVTTHDLPTVAGLWSGADLVEQRRFSTSSEQSLVNGAAELRGRLDPDGSPDVPGAASAIGAGAEAAVGAGVEGAAGAGFERAVEAGAGAVAEGAAGAGVEGAVEAGVEGAVEAGVEGAVEAGVEGAVEAAYARLARAPATLLSATLEDAVAQERRPNMPGAPNRPNWALPMQVRIEDLAGHPTATAIARILSAAVNRPPLPE